tara:strand:+ start:120 stop:293 length:174 start_codon:yes stop_codon:yes gene_type:complete
MTEDRYIYLHLEDGIQIHVKLDDEGVVVDAWSKNEVIGTTCKPYDEMGIEIKTLETN